MKRPDLSGKPFANIYPEQAEEIEKGICPMCGVKIERVGFKDELSKKEYWNSGLCQECQDSVFDEGG